jgi:hypothetical protein
MTASTTAPGAPDAGAGWVPVDSCTLPTADRPLRAAEFDDLFATALRAVQRPAAGAPRARLVLAGDATLPGRVQRLADAETSCCSFFTFTVTEASGAAGEARVALDIQVPPARTAVLDALVGRAAAQVPA